MLRIVKTNLIYYYLPRKHITPPPIIVNFTQNNCNFYKKTKPSLMEMSYQVSQYSCNGKGYVFVLTLTNLFEG